MPRSDFDLDFQASSMEGKIIAALERVSQAFRVLLWQESKAHSLSPIQVQVLIFLHFHSGEKRKVSYLASEFNMTKATISETVKALEQKALIRREPEPNDSRSHTIQLTEAGREIAAKTSLFTQEMQQPIAGLNPDAQANLLLQLLGIIQHLNQSGVITIQRMCMTCAHYKPGHEGNKHFCALLNQSLKVNDLRVDCPEHVMAQV